MTTDGRQTEGDDEYLTDVAYVRHFVDDLGPENLRLVAALNGFESPPADSFDYCELGCGNGDTLATLAAVYPEARFVGVDFNQAHVDFASGLATAGELGNVHFLKRDFSDLAEENLPRFDYITAFGVLSWIGPEKWQAVLEFARARLKPGGIFYASYNCLPGWAAIEPLRHLLVDTTQSVRGSSLDRARQGVELARILAVGGATYFASNPAALRVLETLTSAQPNYVVHEYFHAHWRSMYFGDVAREMAENELYFVGQLPLYLNYRDLTIPPGLLDLFKRVEDRVVFEGLKDYVINEHFRRDVFVKGMAARSAEVTRAYFDSTRFGALTPGRPIAREVRLAHHTLRFNGPLYDALVPLFANGNYEVAELALLPDLALYGSDRIRDAVRNLVIGGELVPMRGARVEVDSISGAAGLYSVPLAYNQMVLQQPLLSRTVFVLAAPVPRTGITLSLLEAVAMRLVTSVVPEMREAFIDAMIDQDPLEMRVRGRIVEDRSEQKRILKTELSRFCADKLPKLLELGVLRPAAEPT